MRTGTASYHSWMSEQRMWEMSFFFFSFLTMDPKAVGGGKKMGKKRCGGEAGVGAGVGWGGDVFRVHPGGYSFS